MSVEPGALYLNESCSDVQFRDAEGRPLAFGWYPKAKYVTAPPDAASADATLVRVEADKLPREGLVIDHPSFFVESSKLISNDGGTVAVGKGGYAISVPLPPDLDIRFEPTCKRWADEYERLPYRVYVDEDMNQLNATFGHQSYNPPKNAAFLRAHCTWGPHNRNFRLVKAFLAKGREFPDALKPVPSHPGEIVLGKDADVRERYAATELVRCVRKMTGKRLAVVNAPSANAAFRIFIGGRAGTGDAYSVSRKDKDIFLKGGSPRGVIFAMARLLEQVADYTWFRPNEACGLVYRCGETVDFLKAHDEADAPAFPLRTWAPAGRDLDYENWVVHNFCSRTYGVGKVFTPDAYRAKCHGCYCEIGDSFLALPMSQPHDDSFWPMVGGKRQVDVWSGQPCYTNPKVVEATLKAVDGILADPPEEWDFFSYCYSDSWRCCECPECQKPVKYPGGELAMKSVIAQQDPHFRAARTYLVGDRIARRVREKTGKPTEMLAYIYNSAPPPFRLDEGMRVLYATYDTSTMRFPTLAQTKPATYAAESWARRFRDWLEFNPKAIGMYEYFFTASPGLYAEAAAANMMEMAKVGGWHVHSQTQGDNRAKSYEAFGRNEQMWDVNALEQWVICRLMWNPSLDPNALRAEAIRRFYGEAAAPAMEDYCRTFAEKWFDPKYGTQFNCHFPSGLAYVNYFTKAKCEERLLKDLATARDATPNAAAKRHLEKMLATLAEMKKAAGRDEVPAAGALGGDEWRDVGSPQWNHALALPALKAFSTEELTETNVPAAKTEVMLAADRKYLYFRVAFDGDAASATDRVELRFKVGKVERLFLLGADGAAEDYEDFGVRYASGWDYVTDVRGGLRIFTGVIPMAAVRKDETSDLSYLVARTDAKGERSYARARPGAGHFYPASNGRNFSTLGVEVDSSFADAKAFPPKRTWSDPAKPRGRKEIAEFPVTGGEGYALMFEASTDSEALPPDPVLRAEAATVSYGAFWHWNVVFLDANGKDLKKTLGGYHRAVCARTTERLRDVFVAPAGAAKAQLVLVPPHPQHIADATAANAKLVPYRRPAGLLLDPTFATGATRVDWPGRTDGSAMRTFKGVRVFDTAYGSFSRDFPLEPGVEYRIFGDRWTYASHHPICVWCLNAKGEHIRDLSIPKGQDTGRFDFTVVPPEGTVRGWLFIHSSYLKNIQVERITPASPPVPW